MNDSSADVEDRPPSPPEEAPVAAREPGKVPAALVEAVRDELRALVSGDLDENLRVIIEIAKRSEELFCALRGAEATHLRGPTTSITMGGPNLVGYGSGGYANPEQFGAQAIRQLVSLVPEIVAAKANSPDRLMKAIALAKKEGHEDIAEALKRRLLGDESPGSPGNGHEHGHAREGVRIASGTGSEKKNGAAATVTLPALSQGST